MILKNIHLVCGQKLILTAEKRNIYLVCGQTSMTRARSPANPPSGLRWPPTSPCYKMMSMGSFVRCGRTVDADTDSSPQTTPPSGLRSPWYCYRMMIMGSFVRLSDLTKQMLLNQAIVPSGLRWPPTSPWWCYSMVTIDNGYFCQVVHTNLPLLWTNSFFHNGLQLKFSKILIWIHLFKPCLMNWFW